MTKKLTAKAERFVEEYPIDLNATQAAIRAGYSKKTARSQGQRLLTNVDIVAAIQKALEKRSERTEITQDRVLQEYAKLAFANLDDFVNTDGEKPYFDFSDATRDQMAAVSEITVDRISQSGEDTPDIDRVKFKLYDKKGTLDSLARHLGMFTDKTELSGELTINRVRFADNIDT